MKDINGILEKLLVSNNKIAQLIQDLLAENVSVILVIMMIMEFVSVSLHALKDLHGFNLNLLVFATMLMNISLIINVEDVNKIKYGIKINAFVNLTFS